MEQEKESVKQLNAFTATKPQVAISIHNTNTRHVFLPTAIVMVLNNYGESIECRALLDTGSQVNLITEQLCRKLRTKCIQSALTITGVGDL